MSDPREANQNTVETPAPEQPPRPESQALPWRVLTIGLFVYVAALAVLTADQVLGWGIVRPRLDRRLLERIAAFEQAPRLLPAEEPAAARQAALAAAGRAPAPLDGILLEISDAAYALEVGVLPSERTLDRIERSLGEMREADALPGLQPLLAQASDLAGRLRAMIEALPGERQRAARQFAEENVEYVINYHEFSVPHLISALRRGAPPARDVAAYCLRRIARRFFREREDHGQDPDAWAGWWRRAEAELERRSRSSGQPG